MPAHATGTKNRTDHAAANKPCRTRNRRLHLGYSGSWTGRSACLPACLLCGYAQLHREHYHPLTQTTQQTLGTGNAAGETMNNSRPPIHSPHPSPARDSPPPAMGGHQHSAESCTTTLDTCQAALPIEAQSMHAYPHACVPVSTTTLTVFACRPHLKVSKSVDGHMRHMQQRLQLQTPPGCSSTSHWQ